MDPVGVLDAEDVVGLALLTFGVSSPMLGSFPAGAFAGVVDAGALDAGAAAVGELPAAGFAGSVVSVAVCGGAVVVGLSERGIGSLVVRAGVAFSILTLLPPP